MRWKDDRAESADVQALIRTDAVARAMHGAMAHRIFATIPGIQPDRSRMAEQAASAVLALLLEEHSREALVHLLGDGLVAVPRGIDGIMTAS